MLPHAELIEFFPLIIRITVWFDIKIGMHGKKSSKSIDHILRQREAKKGKMLPAAGRNAIEKTL